MFRLCAITIVAIAWLSSCAVLKPTKEELLQPAQMRPDSVSLEVFFVRLPEGTPETHGLWTDVDELAVAAEVRRQLATHGFRAGIIGGRVPRVLEEKLALGEQPKVTEAGRAVNFDDEGTINGRYLQLRVGKKGEIQASPLEEEISVLFPADGQLNGQTYRQAQGVFLIKAYPEEGGLVRLQLVPEIQHGKVEQRYLPSQEGVIMLQPSRQRETFNKLRTQVSLAPGQMLMVGCQVDRAGSLGDRFFSEQRQGQREQKLLLIRLAQPRGDDLTTEEP